MTFVDENWIQVVHEVTHILPEIVRFIIYCYSIVNIQHMFQRIHDVVLRDARQYDVSFHAKALFKTFFELPIFKESDDYIISASQIFYCNNFKLDKFVSDTNFDNYLNHVSEIRPAAFYARVTKILLCFFHENGAIKLIRSLLKQKILFIWISFRVGSGAIRSITSLTDQRLQWDEIISRNGASAENSFVIIDFTYMCWTNIDSLFTSMPQEYAKQLKQQKIFYHYDPTSNNRTMFRLVPTTYVESTM